MHAVGALKDAEGFAELSDDEMVIPLYLTHDTMSRDSHDGTLSDWRANRTSARVTGVAVNECVDFGAAIEMTFRRGKLKRWKDLQFGVKTSDPRSWGNFERVWHAFSTQLSHLVRHAIVQQYVALKLTPAIVPSPATFVRQDVAMPRRRNLRSHGDLTDGSIVLSCLESRERVEAIDSLAAIEHLVFDTGAVTWHAMLDAIENNWEGHEQTRQLCLTAPTYGNGVARVDRLGVEIDRVLLDAFQKHPKPNRTEEQAA